VFIGLDQSYVDENHARAYGVCNLQDAETVPVASKKGRRICICDAIASTTDFQVAGELTQLSRGMTLAETQTIEALDRWGSPDHLIGQGISFCGKLWRKCISLIRTYLADLRESDERPQQHEHPEHVEDDDIDSRGSSASSCGDDLQSDFSSEGED